MLQIISLTYRFLMKSKLTWLVLKMCEIQMNSFPDKSSIFVNFTIFALSLLSWKQDLFIGVDSTGVVGLLITSYISSTVFYISNSINLLEAPSVISKDL
jgi:hypothetical protein